MEKKRQSNTKCDCDINEFKVLIRWRPPSQPFLKLNSDGSSRGNPGPSSYGGLIQDHSGEWICGYMGNVGEDTSLEAEVWGIIRGLCLIRQRNLTKVVIETDCLDALLLITVGEAYKNHPQKIAIEYCRRLLLEHDCYMVHIEREGNHCADQIAKLGGKQRMEICILDKPPKALIPFLLADKNGKCYERPPRT